MLGVNGEPGVPLENVSVLTIEMFLLTTKRSRLRRALALGAASSPAPK